MQPFGHKSRAPPRSACDLCDSAGQQNSKQRVSSSGAEWFTRCSARQQQQQQPVVVVVVQSPGIIAQWAEANVMQGGWQRMIANGTTWVSSLEMRMGETLRARKHTPAVRH